MVGIRYNSLADLNSQTHAWCNKINTKIHGTTNEWLTDRLNEVNLLPLKRKYIIDKINLRRIKKTVSSTMSITNILFQQNILAKM